MPQSFARSGIPALDDILGGGFSAHRLYLLEGVPGSGKTTLAMQFLLEGARLGEPVLYVSLSETEEEMRLVADSHGWSLDGVNLHELGAADTSLQAKDHNTMFHPSEVELSEATRSVLDEVERVRPTRVVFDSLSELRLLAGSALRYRRQILALKQYFAGKRSTVLLLDDMTARKLDLQVQSIAHGVVLLGQLVPDFGSDRRRLRVVKYRGQSFRGGYHDYVIEKGGLRVFPRLIAAEHRHDLTHARLSSGIDRLDALLGGGIETGSSTLLVGPAGSGKSSIAAQFAHAGAERGDRTVMFLFDEHPSTLLTRAAGIGVPLEKHVAAGTVQLQPVDPAEMSPGEFANRVRDAAESGARLIVIDSLNGYLNAMPEERFLTIQLHELLMFLAHKNVATILVSAHQGLIGAAMTAPVDATYLADSVVLLRYFEMRGEVRQAISVMKKRGSEHERTIREFHMRRGGLELGEPLREFRGVLTGVPVSDAPETSPPATLLVPAAAAGAPVPAARNSG